MFSFLEGKQVKLKCLYKAHMLCFVPCTLEHANEDVLQLVKVLEHSMSLKVLQVQAGKDILVVDSIFVQANTVIV